MKNKFIYLTYMGPGALVIILLLALSNGAIAQNNDQQRLHPQLEVLTKPQSTLNWINFREETSINPLTVFSDMRAAFQLSEADSMFLIKKEVDKLGFSHYRYRQYYKNRRVVYGEYILHQQSDGFVKSANGNIISGLNLPGTAALTEQSALASALRYMNAPSYLWQNSVLENELKRQEKNPNATYYPKGELVYAPSSDADTYQASDYRLAWHFKIYTNDASVLSKSVYVDAITGKVIHAVDIAMKCSSGSGTSAFNGNVTIHTRLVSGSYRSHNDCQATDIYVYNCNGGAATNDFYTDADNNWSATTQQSAVQAQWGAEMTYDYFWGQHGRQSWDGAAGDMIAYNNSNHPGLGLNNACWGCTGNSTIYGAGSTSAATDDWNPNDIMGHEFAHGVTQASADLVYRNESGALNESFSDIFGEMVESWSEGNCDFLVGADRGAIRSLSNPKAFGHPDTYLGTNWYTGTADNGGVHTNSGVQNRWFYLLSAGGSGTNDLGRAYSVTGIGRFKARVIAYRALTVYLTSNSQYIDARKATLQAAWDLYGQCSPEIIAVGDAWHAVGVESQSPAYAFNVCGSFPASGTFVQAISELTAAGSCTVEITPSSTTVYFTARDRVILRPGFKATAGSRFIAYLEPCSSTRWATPSDDTNIVMSDAEKGFMNKQNNALTVSKESVVAPVETTASGTTITPNPFHTSFDISISSKQDTKAQVVVYNSLGEKIQEKRNITIAKGLNKISINGGNWVNGIYMVETIIDNVRTVKKIIKM
jgi:bacillolysin